MHAPRARPCRRENESNHFFSVGEPALELPPTNLVEIRDRSSPRLRGHGQKFDKPVHYLTGLDIGNIFDHSESHAKHTNDFMTLCHTWRPKQTRRHKTSSCSRLGA